MLKFKEIGVFFEETGVGIQSGPSRDPIGHQFLHFWAPLLASRDPVGHQFSNFWHHVWTCREAAKITEKHAKTLQKCYFLWIWLPPDIGARLDPDWIPTGSRLDPDWPKAVPKNAKIGARLGPDGILTGSIDWQEPTPAPIFPFPDPPLPLFSFPRTSHAPIPPPLLHQNGKSSLKPNGGSTIYWCVLGGGECYINCYTYIHSHPVDMDTLQNSSLKRATFAGWLWKTHHL